MSVEAKQEKQIVIDEIKQRFDNSVSVVVVDYLGITVAEADELRKTLRENNVGFTVYKNTLVRRAIEGTPYEGLTDILKGSSAFAFCEEDATASARLLSKAIKQYKKMAFKGGVVDGEVYDSAQIEALADIPSREELLARFMGSVKSPISQFVRTVQAIIDDSGEAPAAAEA
jgi:large subunit ribosomal protein L10